MNLIRRAILAFALIAGITPAFAQAPPPVPGLPDTERRTSYSISATTCICNVNFALYGDSTDYQNWVEVYLNGALVNFNDATFGWTITSPTGPLASIPRPVTDAVLTFTNAQTGTVQIVGARRPRRVSQFSENRGVPARDLNQVLTDIIAQNREIWDKTNDFTGRALVSQPGVDLGLLPLPSACQGKFLGFDATGLIPQCNGAGPGSGNVTGIGSSTAGNVPVYADATGANIQDSGIKPTSPKTCTTSNWFNTLAGGTLGCSQPNFTDLAGSIAGGQIPTGTITSTMILDGTILNADINSAAAIALTKLATVAANTIVGSTAGGTPAALNGAQAGSILCLPNRQVFTTGTNATYTTPTCNSALPTRIEWEMAGGGGGGAGSGTTPGTATAGGNSCINTSSPACTTPLFAANGGALGSATGASFAAGGTTSGCDLGITGGGGGETVGNTGQPGGWGGASFFGGQGVGAGAGSGPTAQAGGAASAGSGSGGGGASSGSTANNGGGGGAGGYCRKLQTSPASSYIYTSGAAGTGGTLGTSGAAGGAGAGGLIIATAYWQ